jgi:hypothetical protein
LIEAIFTTAHHANGAFLIVVSVLGLCFWLLSRRTGIKAEDSGTGPTSG